MAVDSRYGASVPFKGDACRGRMLTHEYAASGKSAGGRFCSLYYKKGGVFMAVTEQKKAIVANLKEILTSSKGAVITSYKGLTVAQDTALRVELRKAGVTYHVIKNTMTRIAAKEAGLDDMIPFLEGTTAMAYSADDAVAPAKVISEFIKKNNLAEEEKLVVKGGIVEGKVVSADEVKAIASLPSREILIGKLLGSMQAPVSNTVGIMGNMVRSIVNVLDAIRKQKEEQASA
jgi:large subunit ribosomal protein L10